jgi:GT2 family glycosyltransferase
MSTSQKERPAKVSIIIVNFNSGDLLKNCLSSICHHVEVDFEVIVYDNASADTSISSLTGDHRITIIRGKENLGFARANNLAAAHASGAFLHFLNPDIVVTQSLNDAYKQILASNDESIRVTGLTNEAGQLQKNRHLIPRLGNLFRYITGRSDVAYWNLGASLVMPANTFNKIGKWPEDYFMYAEDLDLFYAAFRQKVTVKYMDIHLMHIGRGTTKSIWSEEERAAIIEKSFMTFFRKYNALWEYYIIRPVQLCYLLFNEPKTFLLYAKVFLKVITNKDK